MAVNDRLRQPGRSGRVEDEERVSERRRLEAQIPPPRPARSMSSRRRRRRHRSGGRGGRRSRPGRERLPDGGHLGAAVHLALTVSVAVDGEEHLRLDLAEAVDDGSTPNSGHSSSRSLPAKPWPAARRRLRGHSAGSRPRGRHDRPRDARARRARGRPRRAARRRSASSDPGSASARRPRCPTRGDPPGAGSARPSSGARSGTSWRGHGLVRQRRPGMESPTKPRSDPDRAPERVEIAGRPAQEIVIAGKAQPRSRQSQSR